MDVSYPVFGDLGTFTAPPTGPLALRIIFSRQDPVITMPGFEVPLRSPGWKAEIRQADVPVRPRAGTDTLVCNAVTYSINDVEEDEERTVWRLDLST